MSPAAKKKKTNSQGPGCTVHTAYCKYHNFYHGGEAEELRNGIEEILQRWDNGIDVSDHSHNSPQDYEDFFDELKQRLYALLDNVDARDSEAFVMNRDDQEEQPEEEEGEDE